MQKIFLVANHPFTLSNFRRELIIEMSKRGLEVWALFPFDKDDPFVQSQFKNIPVKLRPIFLSRRGINPLTDLITYFHLVYIFKTEKPDIVLNFTVKPNIYSGLAARFAKVNKIYSNITGLGYLFTDIDKASFFKKLIRSIVLKIYKFSLKKQTGVFFQNKDDRNFFIHKKIVDHDKALLINGSGVDLDFFSPKPSLTKIDKSFIFVGRLLKDKGVDDIILATRHLKNKGRNFKVTIVGDIDNNPMSLKKNDVLLWEKEGNINYCGHLNDVRDELSKSQVLLLPSYREGTPRSVLEAMAMGLAVIATDVPGCRETVKHGENGLLVPPKNYVELANAMEVFMDNPDLAHQMGLKGRDYVKEKFDVKKVNIEITSVLLN